jgi:hypothetical protein
MLFRLTTDSLPDRLAQRFRESLQALDGLNGYEQLELACRQAVGILQTARGHFDATQERREDFDALCDDVEDWLHVEIARARFARTE